MPNQCGGGQICVPRTCAQADAGCGAIGENWCAALFEGCEYAWEVLKKLKDYLQANLRPALHNRCEGTAWIGEQVFIGAGTVLEDGAMIKGPAIIGRNCRNCCVVGPDFACRCP